MTLNDTTTAVATTDDRTRARPPAVQSGGTISAMIPTDIDQAFRLARAIAMSGMAPKAYGNDENKCFVGILAGAELGLAPFQSLQSIAVIGNNPAVWGDGALALVQASGLLEDIEETDDGQVAKCRLRRKGRSTDIIRSFSMDDARKAGLSGKAGPWSQYPQRMRQMRARAWAMRDGFADVLKGLHIAEEVRDRTDLIEAPKTTRLSNQMLAEQAGVTIEQPSVDQSELSETEPQPEPSQAEAARQTLDDIDGPLEQQAQEAPEPESDPAPRNQTEPAGADEPQPNAVAEPQLIPAQDGAGQAQPPSEDKLKRYARIQGQVLNAGSLAAVNIANQAWGAVREDYGQEHQDAMLDLIHEAYERVKPKEG